MSAQSKYLAGSETAKTDRKRGMSLDAMTKVPQPDDNAEWVAGYRDRLTSYQKMCECQSKLSFHRQGGWLICARCHRRVN